MLEAAAGYVLLLARVVLAGWVWTRPEGSTADRAGRVVALGLVLNLLPALALASFQQWSPMADQVAWLVVVAAGALVRRGHGLSGSAAARDVGRLALLIGGVGAVALVLPLRSEWLAGGWDPGIYQNNAVVIARHHGFEPRAESIYNHMTEEERRLFVRSGEQYHEIFPSIPVDIATGRTSLYFFHLTPLCGAWFLRHGGMELLHRMPMLLAWWALLPMVSLAGALGMSGRLAFLGGALLALSPLWWYHQAIPASEMLYLLLLIGGLVFYLDAWRGERRCAVPLWLMLFAATVNHFNVPVLAAMLLGVAAVAESVSAARGRFVRLLGAYAALALGMWWDLRYAGITIARLDEKDAVLSVVLPFFGVGAGLGLAVAAVPWLARWKDLADRMARALLFLFAGMLIGCAAVFAVEPVRDVVMAELRRAPLLADTVARWLRLAYFAGVGPSLLAGIGFAALAWWPAPRVVRVVALALMLALLALLINPGIAPIYPWALRRFFMVMAVAMALGQAAALWAWWQHRLAWPRLVQAGLALVVAFFLFQTARHVPPAMRVRDHVGMAAWLEQAGRLVQPGDLVVADDPRWGTPLFLMLELDVISGRRLWNSKDPDYQTRYLAALDRLRREESRRVVWLTSTRSGMAIYTMPVGEVTPRGFSWTNTFSVIVHGERAKSFVMEQQEKVFGVHEWKGLAP